MQTEDRGKLLDHFRMMLKDQANAEPMRRHYAAFLEKVEGGPKLRRDKRRWRQSRRKRRRR